MKYAIQLRPALNGMAHPSGTMRRAGLVVTTTPQIVENPPQAVLDEKWFLCKPIAEQEKQPDQSDQSDRSDQSDQTTSAEQPPAASEPSSAKTGPTPPRKRGRPRKNK